MRNQIRIEEKSVFFTEDYNDRMKKLFIDMYKSPSGLFKHEWKKELTKSDILRLAISDSFGKFIKREHTEKETDFCRIYGFHPDSIGFYAGFIAGMKYKEECK